MLVQQVQEMDELQTLLDRMNFLHQVSQKLSEKKALSQLLREIMEDSKLVMNAEASSLLLYDKDEKHLYFQVATGKRSRAVKKFVIPIETGIAGWVATHRKPLNIEDCYTDPRFNPDFDKKSKFTTKSMICVPLLRKHKLIGVMQVINKTNGEPFDDVDTHIFETLAAQCAIAIENAQLVEEQLHAEMIKVELQTARAIQLNLLPKKLPEYKDISVAARLEAAAEVGGDYYNIIRLNDHQSLFFIADVTGKGIPAALIVSTIHSSLQMFLNMHKADLNLIDFATTLNHVLIESTTMDKFATCWFGLYNHQTRELTSLNAGHNPPFIFRKSHTEPIKLETGGLFLGGIEVPLESETVTLLPDDVMVIYTDGVTEAWNKQEEEYDEPRLIRVVETNRNATPETVLDAIFADVYEHVGNAKQSDDVTCFVVKVG